MIDFQIYFSIFSLVSVSTEQIYQAIKTAFDQISKHFEVRQKYSAMPRLETWSLVFCLCYIMSCMHKLDDDNKKNTNSTTRKLVHNYWWHYHQILWTNTKKWDPSGRITLQIPMCCSCGWENNSSHQLY